MNSSEFETLRPRIYNYLGFHKMGRSPETDALVADCVAELEKTARFRYIYTVEETVPGFLKKPPYSEFLEGASGVMISAMTLGIEVDKKINRLFHTDVSRGAAMDASASAYLEYLSDKKERELGAGGPRFCPGYGGSSVSDLKFIFEILHPEKIGITLNESDFMLPSKSMAGIIALGKEGRLSCRGCFMAGSCEFLKEGKTCFDQVKK